MLDFFIKAGILVMGFACLTMFGKKDRNVVHNGKQSKDINYDCTSNDKIDLLYESVAAIKESTLNTDSTILNLEEKLDLVLSKMNSLDQQISENESKQDLRIIDVKNDFEDTVNKFIQETNDMNKYNDSIKKELKNNVYKNKLDNKADVKSEWFDMNKDRRLKVV